MIQYTEKSLNVLLVCAGIVSLDSCDSGALANPFDAKPLECIDLPSPTKDAELYERLQEILDANLSGYGGRNILDYQNAILVSECSTFAVVRIIPGGGGTEARIGSMVTIIFGKSQWVDWIDGKYSVFLY